MKIKNNLSGRIIDVPPDHAQMLFKQDWEEYKGENIDGMQEQRKETPKKVRGIKGG